MVDADQRWRWKCELGDLRDDSPPQVYCDVCLGLCKSVESDVRRSFDNTHSGRPINNYYELIQRLTLWPSSGGIYKQHLLVTANQDYGSTRLDPRFTKTTTKLATKSNQRPASGATTEHIFTQPKIESYVHAEWEINPSRPSSGMAAEVVVRVQDEDALRATGPVNSTGTPPYPVEESPAEVIVRAEEILLVVLVLMIWVAAIALFFNRWGKIRMLEPYQPKFQQQHRTSCPIGDAVISPQVSEQKKSQTDKKPSLKGRMKEQHQRMSFSKYNVNYMGDNALYNALSSPNTQRRPRQNSVFVGSSTMAVINPPRRVKSAIDIQHMVLSDYYSPGGSLTGCTSLLPMLGTFANRDKRPSITVDKIAAVQQMPSHPRHRASVVLDQPFIAHHHHPSMSYKRRQSCRPYDSKLRHFISFDQPTTSWDRRTSITIERPSSSISSRKPARLSLDCPGSNVEQPALIIEPPSTSQEHPPTSIADGSSHRHSGRSCPESMVSLHHPSTSSVRRPSFHLDMPPPSPSKHRLSVSLDHTAARMMDRRSSESRNVRSPASASFDETQIKLSNLEHSKVSDV
ncbi:uncharacterized protein CBL_00871 [Carabus blaptoides fortunei]